MDITRQKSALEIFGLPPAPTTGRERLISAGVDLFYRRGYNAVGLDQIIEHAGVTKTTFYNHFESKDELVIACISARDEWENEAWDRAITRIAGDDPRARLLAHFDVLDAWFNDPEFRGCMFINTAAEFSDPRDPIHKAAADHKKKFREMVRGLASRLRAPDPDALADEFTILIEGTLIMRHVHGRNDAARVARAAAIDLLKRHISL